MRDIHRRDLIIAAVAKRDNKRLDLLVEQLADAERTREILRAKGYGDVGMSTSRAAALVPSNKPRECLD